MGNLEVFHSHEHLTQDGVDLQAGEMLAEAHVRSTAEGDVLIGRAGEVEVVGVGETGRIAVGGAEVHHHLVASGDGRVADAGVAGGRAAHVDHRAGEAQQLLARRIEAPIEVVHQPGFLVGIGGQGEKACGQQVAGGVAASVDQQQEEQQEFRIGEAAAVDLAIEQARGKVVAGVGAFAGDQVCGVAEHRHHRPGNRPLLHGLGRRMDGLGMAVESAAVVQREPHQLGDDIGRHLAGDVGDKVAFAPLNHGVDDLAGQFVQPQPLAGGGGLGELRPDELAEGGVMGRVHHQHHLRLAQGPALADARVGDHDGRLGREGLEVVVDGEDIVIASQRPETGTVRLGVSVDRRVGPQAGIERGRVAVGEGRGIEKIAETSARKVL